MQLAPDPQSNRFATWLVSRRSLWAFGALVIVIGGLLVSTFATLTILPSIYAILQGKASIASPSLNPMDPTSRYYDKI